MIGSSFEADFSITSWKADKPINGGDKDTFHYFLTA